MKASNPHQVCQIRKANRSKLRNAGIKRTSQEVGEENQHL